MNTDAKPMSPCPHCQRSFRAGVGLSVHLSMTHGILSANVQTNANRRWRGLPARPAKPRTARHAPLSRRPDGPIALMEAVLAVARADAVYDPAAAAWLDDLRRGVAHCPGQPEGATR